MSVTESPVTTVPGFVLNAVGSGTPEVFQLYQVQTVAPERIESVYMTLAYGNVKPTNDVFALQLRDPSGVVLFEQPTPDLIGLDTADLVVILGWSRLGNDTAQLKFALHDDGATGWARAWANMRLPDLVLANGSTVQLLSWSNVETMSGTIPVSDASVTVTRNAGAVSTTTLADVLPLLTPTDEG